MLLAISIIIFVIFFWMFYTKFFGAEYQAVPSDVLRKMIKFSDLKKNDIVYDLGCGDGKILLASAKHCRKATGIEIDPIRCFIAKIKTRKMNNVEIVRGNFFQQNLQDADVIFIFLRQETNDRLEGKFLKELKKGTKIVSHCWKLSLKPYKQDEKLKVYAYRLS